MPLGHHHPPSTCFHLIIIDHLQPRYLSYAHSAAAWGILCLCACLCTSPLPTPPSHSLLTTIDNLFTHSWGAIKHPFCLGSVPSQSSVDPEVGAQIFSLLSWNNLYNVLSITF